MEQSEQDDLVTNYLAYEKSHSEDLSWAWNAVIDLVIRSADEGLEVVRALIGRSGDEATIFRIAAGPLEELLARHGPTVVDRLLEIGGKDQRMRLALARGVWGRNRTFANTPPD
jgi:hypothetical protein